MKTLSDVKRRMNSHLRWMTVLSDGLAGKPHGLSNDAGNAFEKYLKTLGLEAISMTRATGRGLKLRKGAKPICSRYYKRPISTYNDLYLLQHFTQAKPEVPVP